MFRDEEVWTELGRIINNENRTVQEDTLRIFRAWSAGCATGEEAYSLASLLGDSFRDRRVHWRVYATDICLKEKIKNTGMAKVKNCYNLQPTAYNSQTSSKIRFRYHNLVEDVPLRAMSLILCRNVLMFMKREYQEVVYCKFYEALRKGGYLVLGRGESLHGVAGKLFTTISQKLRIYQKIY